MSKGNLSILHKIVVNEINGLISEVKNSFIRNFLQEDFNNILNKIYNSKKEIDLEHYIDEHMNSNINFIQKEMLFPTINILADDYPKDELFFNRIKDILNLKELKSILINSCNDNIINPTLFKELKSLLELKDGWLNGEGKALDKLGLITFFMNFDKYYKKNCDYPKFFPMESGNISVEWVNDKFDISLTVNLHLQSAIFSILNVSNGDIDDVYEELDLKNNSDWDTLNSNLSKYFLGENNNILVAVKSNNYDLFSRLVDEINKNITTLYNDIIMTFLTEKFNSIFSFNQKGEFETIVNTRLSEIKSFLKQNFKSEFLKKSDIQIMKKIYHLISLDATYKILCSKFIKQTDKYINYDKSISNELNAFLEQSEEPKDSKVNRSTLIDMLVLSDYIDKFLDKSINTPITYLLDEHVIKFEWSNININNVNNKVVLYLNSASFYAKLVKVESNNTTVLADYLNLYFDKSWYDLNAFLIALLNEFNVNRNLDLFNISELENDINENLINKVSENTQNIIRKELNLFKSLNSLNSNFNKAEFLKVSKEIDALDSQLTRVSILADEKSLHNYDSLMQIYDDFNTIFTDTYNELKQKNDLLIIDEEKDKSSLLNTVKMTVNDYKRTPILKGVLSINNIKVKNFLISKYEHDIVLVDENDEKYDGLENIEEYLYSYSKRYWDKILKYPMDISSELNYDIKSFYSDINISHYGMTKAKQIITEIITAQNRNKSSTPPVICLVGAPGVGKTSLIHSISKALNRAFYKISLNGCTDLETLLSGFSEVYRGSRNGRLSQALIDVGVNNPLILLDEIDKITSARGSISDGLLSVLDSSQNKEFYDAYFGFEIDLSKVFFICTANDARKIDQPLLDRMILINLDGYSNIEKLNILKDYSLPKILENNGINEDELSFSEAVLNKLIEDYSIEAGIRKLEQLVDSLCKKFIFEKDVNGNTLEFNLENLSALIDRSPIDLENNYRNEIGYINGLYVNTNHHGGIIKVESVITKGNGKIMDLGLLGGMTKNSIQVIHNLFKSNEDKWNLPTDFFIKHNICVNLGGSTSVDGPSAGTAIVCSIMSSIKNIGVPNNIAMTGEIDLHGNVLPIGGCREKILGGKREGVNKFFFPIGNENKVKRLSDEVKNGIEIIFVKNIMEIFKDLNLVEDKNE